MMAAAAAAAGAGSAGVNSKLGQVTYKCPTTGLVKSGQILEDGRIWHVDGTFEDAVEWLDEAPLREPPPSPAELEESIRVAAQGSLAHDDEDVDSMYEGMPRGRRRSRSVQSPTSSLPRESLESLNSVQDEIDQKLRLAESTAQSGATANLRQREPMLRLFGEDLCKRLYIWEGVPTSLVADSIVRACPPNLVHSFKGSVWEHAFLRAGIRLAVACETHLAQRKISALEDGGVLITPAFELPSKYIIHVACNEDMSPDESALRAYYEAALAKAKTDTHIHSMVLPLLGDIVQGGTDMIEASAAAMAAVLARAAQEEPELDLWGMQKLVLAGGTHEECKAIRAALERLAPAK
ncbi:Protein GDAP2-like [Hondaea fermentalgiana]|uniref:Protein GDAP2-like n=1 Tax=Hondaea fermentalgiana TaxID=2315210 RepID=A0A2R5GDI8_9STRA|nr:Protein GDAP2-like [Hondaea fermentalgiana]|eukprot:GBG26703.1 Protein GDAP2-like [Hondaea fermentalgiana]